jgi:nitroreductase
MNLRKGEAVLISLLEKRRSIRKFKNTPIEMDKIEYLKEAVLRSPSSRSLNPWEFIFVTDAELLNRLAQSKPHGASFLKGATLGVVVCADPAKSDVWVEDCAIASIFLHLAAASIGLGSCWVQIRKRAHDQAQSAEAYIIDLLKMPGTYRVESVVAIGYPDEAKKPHAKESLPYAKIFVDRYGQRE